MIAMPHPFANTTAKNTSVAALAESMAESFWLKEAKAALRSRDPLDAAYDVEALARWADLRCGDILQTATPSFFLSNSPSLPTNEVTPC